MKSKILKLKKSIIVLFERIRFSRLILLVLLVSFVVMGFQNCGNFSAPTLSGSTLGSSAVNPADTDQNNPNSNPTPSPSPNATATPPMQSPSPTPVPTPTQDEIDRAACKANENAPNLLTLGPTTALIKSGLSTQAGDVNSASMTTTSSISVKNASLETAHNCDTYRTVSSLCEVATDSLHLPVISRAIDITGVDVSRAATTPTLVRDLLNRAIALGGCNNRAIPKPALSLSFTLGAARGGATPLRCVEGSFYLAVRTRSTVDGTSLQSAPQYVRVTVNDSCWNESKLTDAGMAEFPRLALAGSSVSIDGDWAVAVASQQSMGSVYGAGAVHVYQYNGVAWIHNTRLQLPDALADDSISSAVIKGDTIVFTSAYRNGEGAAFVYRRSGTTWAAVQSITPPRSQPNQLFGQALAFDGNSLVISAPHYSRTGADRSGAAYFYSYSGGAYVYQQTLEWSGADYVDRGFGMSLALDGAMLAVGSPQAMSRESLGRGAVGVYSLVSGQWQLQTTQLPQAPLSLVNGLKFGAAVSVKSGRLLVGAPGNDGGGGNTNAGAAILYDVAASSTVTKVFTSAIKDGLRGNSVLLGSAGLYFGSPYVDARSGTVSYYLYNSYTRETYLGMNWARTANDGFGWSIAESAGRVIIGARIKNDPQSSSGAVYIYQLR